MTKPIIGSRLKELRERHGLSQDGLAKSFKPVVVDKQTIYRWESDNPPVVRSKNLAQLAKILDVDEGVLTGDLPLPPKGATPNDETAKGFYEMRVRVSGQTRNAFWLASLRYDMPITEILKIAPLLLVHAAEESLVRRRKLLKELIDTWHQESAIERKFPHWPFNTRKYLNGETQKNRFFDAEQVSISARDVFGRLIEALIRGTNSRRDYLEFEDGWFEDDYDEWAETSREKNPLAEYLRAAAEERAEPIEISTPGADRIPDYKICRETAVKFAGGDEDLANGIQDGWVLLHEMPRGLLNEDALAERIEWLRPRIEEARENARLSAERFKNMTTEEKLKELDLLFENTGDEP